MAVCARRLGLCRQYLSGIGTSGLKRPLTAVPSRSLMSVLKWKGGDTGRVHYWQQYGVVGSNLPFSITNRYRVTLVFTIFFATAFNAPFLLVRHQLLKSQG